MATCLPLENSRGYAHVILYLRSMGVFSKILANYDVIKRQKPQMTRSVLWFIRSLVKLASHFVLFKVLVKSFN